MVGRPADIEYTSVVAPPRSTASRSPIPAQQLATVENSQRRGYYLVAAHLLNGRKTFCLDYTADEKLFYTLFGGSDVYLVKLGHHVIGNDPIFIRRSKYRLQLVGSTFVACGYDREVSIDTAQTSGVGDDYLFVAAIGTAA